MQTDNTKRLRALLLCALAGMFGVHRFYLQRHISGVVQFLLMTGGMTWGWQAIAALPEGSQWPDWLIALAYPAIPMAVVIVWMHVDLLLILLGRLDPPAGGTGQK
ncbi:NINE protein [Chitinilyticum piscinae]|uniref:TM2 domain-containing protein n=1 Tax=Chitinilyticum piscinae TaxID=2866724 RepID=A0A8J7KGF4_9NEIS|nr:NINE protein [Chitinilyticum piscinae]MBE9610359.1 TM2 domain-containing protein [Chitinilyticum piscinae]